ncbi:MAG: hypothetical protein COB15_01590 [Flavobacteriales bacterium]|nr:MAG: hypothetical protein COB15_01590 [Flavobacteriales bacterium]
MNIKELHFGTMMLQQDDVILFKLKDDIKLNIDEAIEIVHVTMDIAKNKPFRSLVDARDIFGSMDSEAKEYVVHHKGINRLTIAQAIVANNIATRLVVSIYIGFNKSSHPIRMFSDIDEARAWLLQQFHIEVNPSKELLE